MVFVFHRRADHQEVTDGQNLTETNADSGEELLWLVVKVVGLFEMLKPPEDAETFHGEDCNAEDCDEEDDSDEEDSGDQDCKEEELHEEMFWKK